MSNRSGITDAAEALANVSFYTRRLGGLPIVKHFLDRLRVREFVDSRCPTTDQLVTHGDCVEALVMAMFLETHALSRVGERLGSYDLEIILGRPIEATMLHDTRLGECLDAIYDQAPTIHGDIVAHAVKSFSLDTRAFNLDGTKILLSGEYNCPEDYDAHLSTIAVPERGWNPQGRRDLKQLQFFLAVNRDHFPFLYNVTDGAAGETGEYLKLLQRMQSIMNGLQESMLVADSKMCAFSTLAEAAEKGLRLVTLIPETFSIRRDLCAYAKKQDELPLLLKTKNGEEYRGISIVRPGLVDVETGQERDTGSQMWRYLVIHSSQLAVQAKERRSWERTDEQATLARLAKKLETEVYACKADANKVAQAWRKERDAKYHAVDWELIEGAVRRGRGRPSGKGLKVNDETGWGVRFVFTPLPEPDHQYDPEAMFVLLTTVSDRRVISDAGVLEAYRDRNTVEMCFKWMKGPAAVAPVFLKLPSRIQSLGFVLVVWMMIYSLIQRELRQAISRTGGEIKAPHPDKRWTDKPTTRGVLDVFLDVDVVHCTLQGLKRSEIRNWDARHQRVIELLNIPRLYLNNSHGAST